MKILLTGSEGFIGSHLAEKLVKNGHELTCLVLYNSFNAWGWLDKIDNKIKQNIKIVTGDIRDEFLVKSLIKKNTDVVINLAALIGIPYSYRSPKSYFETNSMGILNILNSSINSNVKKIIHTSTSEVYGTPKYIPIDENHLVSAQSPYAASKIAADQIALSYNKSFNLPVTILRPFNTFGPRQSLRAIIPTIITQLIKNKALKLGSLYPTRDLTFVEDTADAFVSTLNKKKDIGEIINIGSGFEISVKDLVSKISKIMGVRIDIKKKKERIRPKRSEVDRLYANNKKAKKILNWTPKYSNKNGFEKGLKKTIEWFSKAENLNHYKTDIFND
jgi:NAD dependent epimerase/dehydratase